MIKDLQLSDLHNPQKVVGVFLKNGDYFEALKDTQGWQERPGSWELWQKMECGFLIRVQRWLKKSVVGVYA